MPNEHAEALGKLKKLSNYILDDMDDSSLQGTRLSDRSWQFQIPVIVCSGLVTIFLGVQVVDIAWMSTILKNSAVVFSAFVTGFHTWNAYADYARRASQEKSFVNKLSVVYRGISLYIEGNDNCELKEYEKFRTSYERIHEEYMEERLAKNGEDESAANEKK